MSKPNATRLFSNYIPLFHLSIEFKELEYYLQT